MNGIDKRGYKMSGSISEFPDPLCDLHDAVEDQLNWLQRMKYVLATADLAIQEKFGGEVSNIQKVSTRV